MPESGHAELTLEMVTPLPAKVFASSVGVIVSDTTICD